MSSIGALTKTLDADKTRFLNSVEYAVSSHIRRQGRNCIALLTVADSGYTVRRWELRANDDIGHYCKVLWKFVRKERYHGYKVDSALTEPIFKIVEEKYKEFFEQHKDELNEEFLKMIAADDLLMKAVMGEVVEKTAKTVSSKIQKKIVSHVVHEVHNSINNGTLHALGHQISTFTATAVGSQVAAVIAHVIIKHFAVYIATAISHFISSTAFQHVIGLLAKKLIIGAVSAAVFHFLASHVAIAAGGSVLGFIAIPLVGAYILYKAHTFPEDLGKAVGSGVRKELQDKFSGINRSVLDAVWTQLSDRDKLVGMLGGNKEIQGMIFELASEYS